MKYKITLLIVLLFVNFTLASGMTEEERKYLQAYGWVLSQQTRLSQYGFTDEEAEAIFSGMLIGTQGEQLPFDISAVESGAQEWLKDKVEANQKTFANKMEAQRKLRMLEDAKKAEGNKAAGEKAIADLVAANKKIKSTPSGLHYEIIEPGNDVRAKPVDKVTVHYRGTLIDGTEFDSSYERGPATFALNRVVKGWTEGLQLIGEGGKIKLYVPSNLAYRDMSRPKIPAGSTLIFEIELFDIVKSTPKKKIVAVTPAITVPQPKKRIIAVTPPVTASPPPKKEEGDQ